MAINKVVYGGSTLIDLSSDTISAETLASGTVAHNSAGEQITGTAVLASDLPDAEGVSF